jgi:hypothetical protein
LSFLSVYAISVNIQCSFKLRTIFCGFVVSLKLETINGAAPQRLQVVQSNP